MATQAAQLSGDALVEPVPAGLTRSGAARLDAIDMMRGLVIVFMVLDHVRDFFHASANSFDPTDPVKSYPLLFATRWITHLCAPTFVFLAGASIFLQKANGKADGELSRFLLTRGAWLVLLEFTVVSFGFNFGEPFVLLQVIWAIGMAMICMAALARLRSQVVLGIGLALLAFYPLVVAHLPTQGAAGLVTLLMFGAGFVPGTPIFLAYAVVPWLGVMCLGFGLAPLYRLSQAERTRALWPLVLGLIALFFVLRGLNGYGNPTAWTEQSTAARTAMAFFDVFKYPPSPDYLCVTLGLSILIFLALKWVSGPVARILLDFGRTPLFTYVCHLYIAHGIALLAALAIGRVGDTTHVLEQAFLRGETFPGWGWPLGVVYAVWLLVVAMLVPLSRWMAGVKRRRRDWWLSYL